MPFYYSRYKKSYEFYFGDRFNLSIEIEYFSIGIFDMEILRYSQSTEKLCSLLSYSWWTPS